MTRKIDFDRDDIIEKAMNTFWLKGYEGTSLKDLLDSTGLQKGSLYNTFKSKEDLFLLCLDRYAQYSRSFFYKEGDPKVYLKDFFTRLVEEGHSLKENKGCLIMNTCLEFAGSKAKAAQKTSVMFAAVEVNFDNVIRALKIDNKKKRDALKTLIITTAFSLREISKFRKDKLFLKQIANNALKEFEIKI